MFVEQVVWEVVPEKKDSAMHLLSMLHHKMDGSGGLIRSLAGYDIEHPARLMSLTFWKGWEDLSRFLSGPKSEMLTEAQQSGMGHAPRPHHYEVIWEWPEEEVGTISGESCWSVHEFYAPEDRVEVLLDSMRQSVPRLGGLTGFLCAGLWMDKNNSGHIALSTRWLEACPPDPELPARLVPGGSPVGVTRYGIYRVKLTDPHHLEVV